MKRTVALSLISLPLLLSLLTACGGGSNPTYRAPDTAAVATATVTPEPTPTPKEPETLEEVIAAIEAYCASEEYDRARRTGEFAWSAAEFTNTRFFDNIKAMEGEKDGGIIITGDASDGVLKGMSFSISVILEYCVQYKDIIDEIRFNIMEPKFDIYGQEVRTHLYSIYFNMSELLKVNWDNFDYNNLWELASDGIIHNQPSQ